MSFGAQVLVRVGDTNTFYPLEEQLACAITEIRVEQHLDKQTTFAIRFQEDFPGDEALTVCDRKFKETTGIAIVVSTHADAEHKVGLECLVRGQVEQVEFDVDVGAAGSVFEVRGKDVRTVADRSCTAHKFKGDSNDILTNLVGLFSTKPPEIGENAIKYLPKRKTFNFRGTVLEAILDLAKKSDFSFWLTYTVEDDATGLSEIFEAPHYDVHVTSHMKPSPRRPEDAPLENLSKKEKRQRRVENLGLRDLEAADLDDLDDEIRAVLRIVPVANKCETVVNFTMKVDNEATEQSSAASIDDATGDKKDSKDQTSSFTPFNPGETVETAGQQPSEDNAPGVPKKAKKSKPKKDPTQVRTLCVGVPGDADVNDKLSKAAVNQAAWYVKGEALTSVFKLGKVVQPHQLVLLLGGGCGVNGVYQVSDVTHVINAAEHWMSINLRTNSRKTKDK